MLYLMPDTGFRRDAKAAVMEGISTPERFLFYGMDTLGKLGVAVEDNIGCTDRASKFHSAISCVYRNVVNAIGGVAGDLAPLLPVFDKVKGASVIVAVSERMGVQLLMMRMIGLVPRTPAIFMTMGLPEILESVRSKWMLKKFMTELACFDMVVCVSEKEQNILKEVYGAGENVVFVPAGVDEDYYAPVDRSPDVDVLSIGADRNRDFPILMNVARMNPEISFRIITTPFHADQLGSVPENMELILSVPMSEIRDQISRARVIAVPSRPNSYSGATTIMLQAMSIGKPVIATRTGANESGYPFRSGDNCVLIEPGDTDRLSDHLHELVSNDGKALDMGRCARETVEEELSIESFHAKLAEMIGEIYYKAHGRSLFQGIRSASVN